MGTEVVQAIQAHGVIAMAKHYVLNDQEHERFRVSVEIDEDVLRELYLLHFEMVVRDTDLGAVMSGYNRIRGTYATENRYILRDILRREWGFTGYVQFDVWWTGRWADSSRVRPLYTVDPVTGLRDVITSWGGAAQVDLIFGAVNPSRKLPTTHPRSVQDVPTAARPERYPGTDEGDGYPVMRYSDGLRRPARASHRSFVVPEGTFTVQHP